MSTPKGDRTGSVQFLYDSEVGDRSWLAASLAQAANIATSLVRFHATEISCFVDRSVAETCAHGRSHTCLTALFRRINQHHAGHLRAICRRVQLHVETPKRVADEEVRWVDFGCEKQLVQVGDDIGRRARSTAGVAVAHPCAVVGACAHAGGDFRLHQGPDARPVAQAGVEDHRDAPFAAAVQVHLSAAADVDHGMRMNEVLTDLRRQRRQDGRPGTGNQRRSGEKDCDSEREMVHGLGS